MTRHLPRSLDEVASTFPGQTFPGTPDSIQATMQATSTTALEPVASNQLLAWSLEIPEKKDVPTPTRNAASNPASDQIDYIEINYKRPVACKVACLEGRKTMSNVIHNKTYASDQPRVSKIDLDSA